MNREEDMVLSETVTKLILRDRIAWVVLILIMVVTGLIRYRLLAVPLERDEGEYAYAGQLILQGIPPYREVYNMKLPGIYAAYAVILAVFGQTHWGIHAGLLVVNEITIVLVFLLAKRLLNTPAAVVSAAVFAIFSISWPMQGVSANAEHFVNVFAVAGLLVMLRALDKNSLHGFFITGILLGITFIMKQPGLAFGALAVVYLILDALFQKPILWRKLTGKILSLTMGIMVVFGCLCLTLVWTGVFKNFWFWTIDYARIYISQYSFQVGWSVFVVNALPIIRSSPLLWAMIGLGLICLADKQLTKTQKTFCLLYAIFSFLSICPGFYFRPHYFILLLPCAALLAGVTVYVFLTWMPRFPFFFRSVLALLLVICFCQPVYKQRNFLFRMTPFEISRSTYGLNPFPESLEIAAFIRSHTIPNDTIAVLGSEPQICFYAHRRSATGYIYMYPLMEDHPFALQMQKDCIREIEAKKPKYIVVVIVFDSWGKDNKSYDLLINWASSYYKQYYRQVGSAELYPNQSVYYWYPNVKEGLSCEDGIFIFERITNQ